MDINVFKKPAASTFGVEEFYPKIETAGSSTVVVHSITTHKIIILMLSTTWKPNMYPEKPANNWKLYYIPINL